MLELDWITEAAAKQLEKDVRQEVIEAVNFADESDEPPLAERDLHVYAD